MNRHEAADQARGEQRTDERRLIGVRARRQAFSLLKSSGTHSVNRKARAFTLVELLVVIVIIVILLSAILVGGTTVINNSRAKSTRAVLQVVHDAVQQFKADEPSIVKARQAAAGVGYVKYRDRYGQPPPAESAYPPDELEVFTEAGIPGCTSCRTLAPGKAEVLTIPDTSAFVNMSFDSVGTSPTEHRDLAAMILAIELYSEAGSAMLDRIPDKHRTEGAVNAAGQPTLFLDRDSNGGWTPGTDQQIRLIVDAWGVPLSYLAPRDPDPAVALAISTNHPKWNEASIEMVRLNGGQPIIMSYGIDGKDQLTDTWMKGTAEASLVEDWMNNDPHKIDHHLNADNIYVDQALNEKLARGLQ